MNLVEIKEAVEKEINDRQLSATAQYLKALAPVYAKGKLQFANIDKAKDGNIVVAYLPVNDHSFYFAVSVDTEARRVISFATEAAYTIFLRATSILINADAMQAMTTIQPTVTWNKGDKNPDSNFDYFFSAITIDSKSGGGTLEEKLDAFLTTLEQDKTGILALTNAANVYIQVIAHHYIADGNLCSQSWSRDLIKRLYELNLEVNVETFVEGKSLEFVS
jgi:Domain of unknown function (DUF4279)